MWYNIKKMVWRVKVKREINIYMWDTLSSMKNGNRVVRD